MDNEREYEEEGQRDQVGSNRDAVGLLRRSPKRPDDEVTPLLDSDASSEAGENGPQEPRWEGFADFEGLSRWSTPSVSLVQFCC